MEKLELFKKVFTPHVQSLGAPESVQAAATEP
jgi:hypothetical protein